MFCKTFGMAADPPSDDTSTSLPTAPSEDVPRNQPPTDLPSSVQARYRDLRPLAALEAEFAQPLLHGVERSSGLTAVVAVLDHAVQPGTRDAHTYDRCTGSWPQHYGVPTVLDAASPETDAPYVAWAVETGDNLRARLDGEALPRRRILEIGRAVAETLAELHRFSQCAHHLTPASIWLGPAGICQILGLGLGAPTHDVVGEGQRYRAPEHLRPSARSMAERVLAEDLGERADIWSLGVILLEMLEGRPHLQSLSADELVREQTDVPWRPPQHLGHELASLLGAMLVLDPVDRTVSAEEVAARLDDLLIDQQISTPRGQAVSRSYAGPPAEPPPSDPPVPIPSSSRTRHPDWRQAVRSVQEHRRTFDRSDTTPAWKIWLIPGVGLVIVLLMIWFLLWWRPSI